MEILPNWHPIFVHFTVALLLVTAALHIASHFVSSGKLVEQWSTTARWNLWIGVAATLLTVAAGMYAYYTVEHDAPSHTAMTVHRNWGLATMAIFLVIAGWEFWLARHGRGRSWLFTGLLVVAAGLLLTTAWHGGELVYRHGLGVKALPKVEGPGHSHTHDDGSVHDHGGKAAEGDQGHAHENAFPDAPAGAATDAHPHEPGAAPHAH